jgi:hypothetical protein
VTIAVNGSPAPLLPMQKPNENASLPAATLSPTHVAADTGSANIYINGGGFTLGMVATWNGAARPTQFVSSAQLQISLSGADLETPGLGMIAVWDSTQTSQITHSSVLVVYVPVMNHDLIYDSLRDKVYVAVAAGQKPQGSAVAILNPETGRIEEWFPLSAEPTLLAISGDSQYLYVAMGNSVQRINLSSWQPDLTIPLGSDPSYGARNALSMITLPGVDTSLAVSFSVPGVSGIIGMAVFDGAKPGPVASRINPNHLVGGPNSGTLYAADATGNFYVLGLTPNGVTITEQATGLTGADGDSVYAAGLFYDGWGGVIDPTVPSVIATYDNQGLILPLPDLQKTLILGTVPPPGYTILSLVPSLTLHNIAGGARLWSLPLPVSSYSNHGPMIRFGQNGVALREPGIFSSSPAAGIDLFRLNLGQ